MKLDEKDLNSIAGGAKSDDNIEVTELTPEQKRNRKITITKLPCKITIDASANPSDELTVSSEPKGDNVL